MLRMQCDSGGCQAPSASQGHICVASVQLLHRRAKITPPSLPPSGYVNAFLTAVLSSPLTVWQCIQRNVKYCHANQYYSQQSANVNYVCNNCLVTHFPHLNFSFVIFSCRISVENIEMEFSSLYVRIKSLEEKVQGDQELLQQLEPFLQVKQQQQLCNTLYTQTHIQKVGSRTLYISGAADSSATDNDIHKSA